MRIATLTLLMLLTGTSWAGTMAVSAMPGGAVIFKKVESIRERRFANLVEQKTDFSCGAAALATILRQAYWLDVDEAHIIKGMLVTADQDLVDGATQGALVDAAAHGGIALGIEVDQQGALPELGQGRRQIDTGGGLADAALLVGDHEYPCHQ